MSLPEEYEPIARAINAQCRLQTRSPLWWGKMLSSIVLALGPMEFSALKYVNASTESESYRIVVVTGPLIVVGSAEHAEQDDSAWSVSVFALKELESVSLRAAEDAFGQHFGFAVWPGRLTVEMRHPRLGELTLPLSSESNSYADEKLLALLPELVQIVGERS